MIIIKNKKTIQAIYWICLLLMLSIVGALVICKIFSLKIPVLIIAGSVFLLLLILWFTASLRAFDLEYTGQYLSIKLMKPWMSRPHSIVEVPIEQINSLHASFFSFFSQIELGITSSQNKKRKIHFHTLFLNRMKMRKLMESINQ